MIAIVSFFILRSALSGEKLSAKKIKVIGRYIEESLEETNLEM